MTENTAESSTTSPPPKPGDVVVDPEDGDRMTCPGCGALLYLDPLDGWRNDGTGYTCRPASTTHSDHIVTLTTEEPA